jgi:hypothetical protein
MAGRRSSPTACVPNRVRERLEAAHGPADGHFRRVAGAAGVGVGAFRVGIKRVVPPGRRLVVQPGHRAEVGHLVVVDDVLQEDRRDEGVDRVASPAKHVDGGLGDVGQLCAHHHAFARGDRLRSLVEARIAGVGDVGGLAAERRRQHDGEGCGRQRDEEEPADESHDEAPGAGSGTAVKSNLERLERISRMLMRPSPVPTTGPPCEGDAGRWPRGSRRGPVSPGAQPRWSPEPSRAVRRFVSVVSTGLGHLNTREIPVHT